MKEKDLFFLLALFLYLGYTLFFVDSSGRGDLFMLLLFSSPGLFVFTVYILNEKIKNRFLNPLIKVSLCLVAVIWLFLLLAADKMHCAEGCHELINSELHSTMTITSAVTFFLALIAASVSDKKVRYITAALLAVMFVVIIGIRRVNNLTF